MTQSRQIARTRVSPTSSPGRLAVVGQSRRSGSVWLNASFALCVLTATSRGFFEFVGGKQLGYATQLGFALLFVVTLFLSRHRETVPHFKQNAILIYALFMVSFASAVYVTMTKSYFASVTYVLVMGIYYSFYFVFSSFRFNAVGKIRCTLWLGIVGLILVVVATLQQRNQLLDVFPGSDLASLDGNVRPSSLTGSYLHYPLAIALISFFLIEAYAQSKSKIVLSVALVLVVAVVVSYSRSGAMILVLSLCAYFGITPSVSNRLKALFFAVCGLPLVLLVFQDNPYTTRIMSSVQAGGAGNATRLEQWNTAIHMWLSSPLLIGSYTGMVTNITKNVGNAETTVVESGMLQQLLSFGLIGVILFYAMFVCSYRSISKDHTWIRAIVVGAVAESFIYQSIEVFPFMLILALAPLYSYHLQRRAEDPVAPRVSRSVGRSTVVRSGRRFG